MRSGKRLLRRRWYLAAASFDPKEGLVTLVQRPLAPAALTDDEATVSETVALVPTMPEGALLMAGLPQADGRSRPTTTASSTARRCSIAPLEPAELDAALLRPLPAWLRRHLVGAWDFADAIPTTRVVDRGPLGLDGELVNLPARAMKGWNWSGETMRWTDRPEHYGAIHFHEDDLYDAGWQADFALTVPGQSARAAPMPRTSGAAGPRTAPRRTTSPSSSARRAAPRARSAGPRPRSWCRPRAISPTPTTTTTSTARSPRC